MTNKANIEKITELLNSPDYENGFELLKKFKNQELNDILEDKIYSCVSKNYFEDDPDDDDIQIGLQILYDIIPNIKSIKINYVDIEEIDINGFKNLTSLDLSHNEYLNNIMGIETLKKLTYLNLRCSPELISPNIQNIKNIKEIYGLRDEMGLKKGNTIDFDHWGDTLLDWLDWDFKENISHQDSDEITETGYFGKIIFLFMDEDAFLDGHFGYGSDGWNWSSKHIPNWEGSRGTPDQFKKAMKNRLSEKAIKEELKYAPDKNHVTVLLYNDWYQYLYGFKASTEDFNIECQECFDDVPYNESVPIESDYPWERICNSCK